MKGHPFEDLFKGFTTLASVSRDAGNFFYKIAEG